MNILIIDNDEKVLAKTASSVKKAMPEDEIFTFAVSADAIASCSERAYGFAFISCELSDMPCITFSKKLKKTFPRLNIIFVSEDEELALDAFYLHASGYLLKPPTPKDIREEAENRRYSPKANVKEEETNFSVVAKAFGQFDLLVNGKSVHFKRAKAKEAIAFLIDRCGSGVTKRDIASAIFEDSLYTENVQDYLGKILREMENTLKSENVADVLIKSHNYYAIDTKKIKCDYFDYLDDNNENKPTFYGEYMSQYSWAESTLANLYFNEEKNGGGDY